MRAPEEAATGVAKARLTFDACKVFDVAAQTVQVHLEPKPKPADTAVSESD